MLAMEFARFLGLPLSPAGQHHRHRRCGLRHPPPTPGPSLVCVDEIHNLNLATRAGADVSDQLKYFAERLPATVLLTELPEAFSQFR